MATKTGALRETVSKHALAIVVCAALFGAVVPRAWCLFYDDSVFYPDEIFQTLEQGHRIAFGYGFIPWEFREAARSWFLPEVLGLVLRLGALVGLSSGPALAHFAKGFMVLLSLAGSYATMRLAHARAGVAAAAIAGAAYASLPPLVVFGARCMSEMASATVIAFGALAIFGRSRGILHAAIAGTLVGASVFLRNQNGIVALTFFAILVVQKRWRDGAAFAAGGLASALILGGVLDWITWGSPFLSLRVYLKFNLLEGQAARWGTAPWWFYVQTLSTSCGPAIVVLLIGLAATLPSEWPLAVIVVVDLVAHSMVPHKELRFVMPVVPLALAAAGVGLTRLFARGLNETTIRVEHVAIGVGLALAGSFGLKSARETYADMGDSGRGGRSVWRADEGATLFLGVVGGKDDLCGLMLDGIDRGYTGAFSYVHRRVPFFNDVRADAQRSANYLIAPRGRAVPGGYDWLESKELFALYGRVGGCAPPPARYTLETGDDPLKK